MALSYELSVYKADYDLLLEIFKFSTNLKREYKFTLGEKLKNEVTDLLTNIYKANKTYNKTEFIDNARENTEIVRLYLRVLKDLKIIGVHKGLLFDYLNGKIPKILLLL